MNDNADQSSTLPSDADSLPVTPAGEGGDGAAPRAPVKRRRTAKVVATSEALPLIQGDAAPLTDAAAPDAAPAAPVRKRRAAAKPKVANDAEAAADSAAPVVVAQDVDHAEVVRESVVPAAPIDAATQVGLVSSGSEAVANQGPADVTEGQDRGRHRGRNRRRGGRDGAQDFGEAPVDSAVRVVVVQAGDDEVDEGLPVQLDEKAVAEQTGAVFSEVLSGAFDVEEAPTGDGASTEPPKRVLLPEPDAPKLQKVLAQSGIGSRRDMEQMIADGLITVNDQVAHVGQRISFGDRIKIDGRLIKVRIVPPPPRIIAYHKPVGEVVTHDDPQHRPTVFRRLPRLPHGKWQSVGRLDLNTEGLLLFTNSGELANKLMHPRFGVEREYAVRVLGTLEPQAKAQLLEGVDIEGQKASFRSIENGGGEGVNHWYRVVITEGRNREVRKLFDAVGLTVSRLIRIRYGTVVLPRGLKRGAWVDLEAGDVRLIQQLAGHTSQPRRGRDDDRSPHGRGKPPRQEARHRDTRRDGPRGADRPMGPRDGRGPGRGGRPLEPRRDGSAFGAERPEGRSPREEGWEDDFDPARIPNPLEQTFDKRFVQNPRSPAGGRGFRNGGGGFGAGGSAPDSPPQRKGGGAREPDPLQTSVGYIGADAFHRKGGRGGRGGGGYGGQGGQGGGGFGGGGSSGGGQGGRGGRSGGGRRGR